MSDPIYFAPIRTPLVDDKTGLMRREWYLFFQALWLRSGGADGGSNTDVLVSISQGLGAAEVQAGVDSVASDVGQLPDYVLNLQAEVAELRKEIQAIQQGPTV